MSVESPNEFSVYFVGKCSVCNRDRQHSFPGFEEYQNNTDGVWSRCQCGKINWLKPK